MDLRETAELARLNMSKEDLEKISPAFEQMLSFFAVMQAAETDKALPVVSGQVDGMAASAQLVAAGNLRPDAEQSVVEKDLFENLLSQAPERDGRFMVIPNVL